jgi:hypothetical protein
MRFLRDAAGAPTHPYSDTMPIARASMAHDSRESGSMSSIDGVCIAMRVLIARQRQLSGAHVANGHDTPSDTGGTRQPKFLGLRP